MAIVTKYRNGCPSWVDVAVPDVAAATAFYTSLFGWDAEDQGEVAGHYTMFSLGGKTVAGMGPRQEEAGLPLWGTYVSVDDLDAVMAVVPDAGGTIVLPRMEVMEAGTMGIAMDATGAFLSFWQPNQHIGSERVNEVGALVWNELNTRDLDTTRGFYSMVLDWEFSPMDADDPDGYQLVTCNGRVVGGILPMRGDEWGDMPSHWMSYFAVEDTDAAAARVAELGGTVSVEPFDLPVGRIAVVNDPAGNAFSIIAMGGPADEIPGGVA